jgi:hypothetical protein
VSDGHSRDSGAVARILKHVRDFGVSMANERPPARGTAPDGAEHEPNRVTPSERKPTENDTELPLSAEQEAATETLDAELVLWRVFGCSNDYAGRPTPYWSVDQPRGPRSDDRLILSLGDVPDELTTTLRQWRAQSAGLLDQIFRGASFDHRVRRYEEDLATVQVREFENPYPSWLSIRLSRPLRVRASRGVLAWLAEPEDALQKLSNFDKEGGEYLDGVVAKLFSLPAELNLGLVRYNDRRGFLVAPGRAALRELQLRTSINDAAVIVRTSWASAPLNAVESLVERLPKGKPISRLTAVPARWLTAALTEEDDLRRFVFAFAGLETLCTAAEKTARARLLTRISGADSTLPVKELLWPSKSDDFADRNLVFRFAAMASVYSPPTTEVDVASFARINRARNDLFHGSENSVDRNLSIECQNLLRKYVGLLARES